MIVVKNTFRVKYGQAKPAIAALKEMQALLPGLGVKGVPRVLTDLTGPAYTILLEVQYENLSAFEQEGKTLFASAEWRKSYDKFVPYVEGGSREIYTLVA